MALSALLDHTIEAGRFPRRRQFLELHPEFEPVIDELLTHGRGKYLVEVHLRGQTSWLRRLAITVPAVRALDGTAGRQEAKALSHTYETLNACRRGYSKAEAFRCRNYTLGVG
jgi:hypothetical protein